jgi:hypothetical protein
MAERFTKGGDLFSNSPLAIASSGPAACGSFVLSGTL